MLLTTLVLQCITMSGRTETRKRGALHVDINHSHQNSKFKFRSLIAYGIQNFELEQDKTNESNNLLNDAFTTNSIPLHAG